MSKVQHVYTGFCDDNILFYLLLVTKLTERIPPLPALLLP